MKLTNFITKYDFSSTSVLFFLINRLIPVAILLYPCNLKKRIFMNRKTCNQNGKLYKVSVLASLFFAKPYT